MISFTHSKTLICINATVESYEYLCQGVLLGSEVIILDPNQDGIEQITQVLRDRIHHSKAPRIQSLHIVSHGSPGCLYLGNSQLNLHTLDQYQNQLQQWSGALTTDAEILLYGCNVGQQDSQQSDPDSNRAFQSSFTSDAISPFIQKLQHLTQAKIAASSTPIGSKKLGGNWQLDVQTDKILSPLAFTPSIQENYTGVLATFTVTNTDDDGPGSLRDALAQADTNDDPEGNIIEFDPAVFSTPQTINLLSQLRLRDDDSSGLTINGPGADILTLSRADNEGNLFEVSTNTAESFVRISGLTIQNANNGIRYASDQGKLEVDSSVISNNNRFGILARSEVLVTNSTFDSNGQIGITLLGNDSIIQGNTFISSDQEDPSITAIQVAPPNNSEEPVTNVQILENFIGTDANGTPGLGHRDQGILISQATGTQVIGNVISGNGNDDNESNGVLVDEGSNNTIIQGNIIGLTPDGTTPLPNTENGIVILDSSEVIIGGAAPTEGNIISGNAENGILLQSNVDATTPTRNTQILGNLIGVDINGNAPLPNQGHGIAINNAANNTIGGQEPGQGNTIAFNAEDGINVINDASVGNGIFGNNIFSNGEGDETEIGIDLGNNGVTANDEGDADVGANNLQNYPQLTQAELAGTDTIIVGEFNSTPNTDYRLEFFSNEAVDPSGNGQGQTFVGTINVTTDAAGEARFTETVINTGDLSGQLLTATATDPSNNTSEFSNPVEISVPSITVTPAGTLLPEGNSGTVDHVYTVEISQPTLLETVINYSTSDGTATVADNDYIANTGSLTFPANPTRSESETQTITVQVNGDLKSEADEVFNLNLSKEGSGNLETAVLTGTIENDDPEPTISVSDITVNEGDGVATLTITASEASGFAATFDYATNDITAAAGLDYTATSGSLTIPEGEITVSFDVPLIDDGLEEPDKSFGITLTNLNGIDTENSTTTATANILDDDFSPFLNLDADSSSNTALGDYQTNFTEGENAVAIADVDLSITDQDSTSLTTATITLENPLDLGNETLSVVGSLPESITTSGYDPISGRLTLTGNATLEDYQTAFSQIVYNNTSNTPDLTPRQIESIVSDGINPSETATTTINITPVNTPPVANNDTIVTRTNTAITSTITNNDFDPDGVIDPSTVALDLTGLNNQGNATVDVLGNLTFTPETGFTGTVEIPYTVEDNQGESAAAQISIIVNPSTNQPPVTQNLITEIIPNTPTPVPIPPLTGTDLDGTITGFQITRPPQNGQLQLNGEAITANQTISLEDAGNLTFTPTLGFVGLAEFEYTAFDDDNASDLTPATYNLLVNVTNVTPLPTNSAVPFVKNISTQVPLPALTTTNNENVDNFTLVELPIGGQVFLNGEAVILNQVISVEQAAQLTFTSNLDFSGSTSLKFTSTDTAGITSQQVGEVSLFVLPNQLPTAQPLELGSIIPTSASVALPPLVATDEDGEVVSFTLNNITTSSEGQLFIGNIPVFNLSQVSEITAEQAENLRFEANENFSGDIVLNYVANDNDGQSSEPAPLSITVLPITPNLNFNIPVSEPVADELIVSEIPNNGTVIEIPPLTANDIDGEIVSFSILELVESAAGQLLLDGVVVTNLSQITELTITQASQLTFIPSATFSGQIQLRYTATNSFGLTSSSSRIVLEVPSISSDIFTLPTDLPLDVLAFTASLAGLVQSYTFITESIVLNSIETSIEGTEIDEILTGTDIAEQIVGLGGNDQITALGGNDNVFGNIGNDTLDAGDGNDLLDGGAGEDFLIGNVGNDTLVGGAENDILVGGSNLIEVPDTDGEDLLDGGDGDDSLFGNQGNDTLIGGDGNDQIFSGKDNDLASGEEGNDTIFGDEGDDNIAGGEGNDLLLGNQGNDTISGGEGNDFIAGGQDNDLLFGDEGDDEVYGDLGEDSVYGNEGNDLLFGGEGNDTLIGGDGEDFLSGDGGDDLLFGGEGADTFALLLNSGSDVIQDFNNGEDLLGLSVGLSFDDLSIEQAETGTLIRFEGQLLVTLNRINLTLITEDDFTTI